MLTDNDKKQLVQELKRLISSFNRAQAILIDTRQEYLNKRDVMEIVTEAFDLQYYTDTKIWDPRRYPYLLNNHRASREYLTGCSQNIIREDYEQLISLDKVIQNTLNLKMNKMKKVFIKEASLNEI